MKNILYSFFNIITPFLLINLLMVVDFFVNGSGIQSTINYEKYKFIWIGFYSLGYIIQLIIVFRYASFNFLYKLLLSLIINILYLYIGWKYFN